MAGVGAEHQETALGALTAREVSAILSRPVHWQLIAKSGLKTSQMEALTEGEDLLDADVYPAADLLDAYRQRWGIEQVFQQVTEVFGLQQLIGSRPEAAVFQAAICFVL